jgi:prophage DNA circulation protein
MGFGSDIGSAVDKLNGLIGLGGSNWRDQLKPASFRGVPFEVFDSDLSGDHRNAKHDYPMRPVGWVESMGPTMEEFSINGFVGGNSYFSKRDALIAALRQDGPGTLIDPYMGEVEVVCGPWSKKEIMTDGRMAVFAMTFTVAGDPAKLIESDTDTGESLLSEALGMLSDASKALADGIALAGQPAKILNAAINKVKGEIGLAMKRIESAVEGVADAWSSLIDQFVPNNGSSSFSEDHLADVQGFIGLIGSVDSLLSLSNAYDGEPYDPVITETAPTERTRQKNDFALNKFFQKTYLGTAAKAVATATFTSYDEVTAVRDNLVGKLIRAGEPQLAGKTFHYLSNRAGNLARLTDVETPHFVSTLELAQRYYGDATRADEILARNRIEHPGFIVHQTLKVLTQ